MMAIISGISMAYEYNSHIGRTCRALTWKRKHKNVATSYSRVEFSNAEPSRLDLCRL